MITRKAISLLLQHPLIALHHLGTTSVAADRSKKFSKKVARDNSPNSGRLHGQKLIIKNSTRE